MAAKNWCVLGGFAILAIVLVGLACPSQAEAAAKEGAVQDAPFPVPKQQLAVDLGGGVTLELIRIPSGTFDMGSEKGQRDEMPVHKVTIKKAFYMGNTRSPRNNGRPSRVPTPAISEAPRTPWRRWT